LTYGILGQSSQQQNIQIHQENLKGIQYNEVFPDWGKRGHFILFGSVV